MMFIVSSGIYRRTWVITQGGIHTDPCMKQQMRMYLRLLHIYEVQTQKFTNMKYEQNFPHTSGVDTHPLQSVDIIFNLT